MKLKVLVVNAVLGLISFHLASGSAAPTLPRFEPDPYWPKHLPNNWILGQVSGVTVDSHDNIWVIHRPRTTDEHDKYLFDKTADCCTPAPLSALSTRCHFCNFSAKRREVTDKESSEARTHGGTS